MAESRGKKFEGVIRECFESVPETSVMRLHDQMTGFKGSTNICDFIVYHYPNQFFIECKSVQGNTFPFSNMTDKQYTGMLEMSKIYGVRAGLIVWWVDHDVTAYIPISFVKRQKALGRKSIHYSLATQGDFEGVDGPIEIPARKEVSIKL